MLNQQGCSRAESRDEENFISIVSTGNENLEFKGYFCILNSTILKSDLCLD